MGASWQTSEQKAFIEDHHASFTQHLDNGTLKSLFWPEFLDKWFASWPLPAPTPDQVEKEGHEAKAAKVERSKKVKVSVSLAATTCIGLNLPLIQQIKRAFTPVKDDHASGGRRNLRLDDHIPRKRSELQVYMSLYYNDRIRQTVIDRWAAIGLTGMDFSRPEDQIPEDKISPEDSSLYRDTKIPLSFKNQIARELYDAEEDEITETVRSRRESEMAVKTVYDTNEEDRLELVQSYQRSAIAYTRYANN